MEKILIYIILISLLSHKTMFTHLLYDGSAEQHQLDDSLMSTPQQQPSPEPLDEIAFCAEKCRYVPDMCSKNSNGVDIHPYRTKFSYPAPLCLNYSITTADDIYWNDHIKNGGKGIYSARNEATLRLVDWAAARARERRTIAGIANSIPCEEVSTSNTQPMMFPEEFEFITKLMASLKPRTYLEWGCGTSTSFYPLMASEKVVAIDGYPPWCAKVGEEPRVKCMSEEGKLVFYCPELLGADGSTRLQLLEVGKIPKATSDEDVEAAMNIYVNAISRSMNETNVNKFDLALVDGRFRVQCALKLLPFLTSDSVVLIHDFWVRIEVYRAVLEYYDVIGYARSVVALKKKTDMSMTLEEESNVYKMYMTRKHLSWVDIA